MNVTQEKATAIGRAIWALYEGANECEKNGLKALHGLSADELMALLTDVLKVEFAFYERRERYVAAAMQGLCANSIPGSHHSPERRAAEAIEQADATIAALYKAAKEEVAT